MTKYIFIHRNTSDFDRLSITLLRDQLITSYCTVCRIFIYFLYSRYLQFK